MIAKRLRLQSKQKSSIVRLVEYITATHDKSHRVGEVFITNCHGDTPKMAACEMLAKQLMNTRAKSDKTYHLMVSFRFGEQPKEQVLRRIEAELCAKLGFSEHQRVAVVHWDTDHVHMHIAINKIHPKKLTIRSPYYDFDALGKACEEIEQKLFLRKDNHKSTGKTKGERQAKDIEALTGNESLYTWIRREVFEKLKVSDSWKVLHQELAKAGLTLSLRGAGVIVTSNSGHRITGSNIDRSFSKFQLEKRLGKFQPRPESCNEIKVEREYLKNPDAPENPLRKEYEALRDARDEDKDLRLGKIDLEYARKKEAILAENVLDRQRARNTWMAGRFHKHRLYTAIHKKFRSQMEELNAATKRAREVVYKDSSSQTWVVWLQEQAKGGRQEALEALRKRAFSVAKEGGAALRGEKENAPASELIPDQKIETVTKMGTVIYSVGADAIRDDRESFRVSAGAIPETDILALQLAKRRFGKTIFVEGDRAFRERMIKAAVEGKIYIKFGDPLMERQRNELFRSQYQERKRQENTPNHHNQRSDHGPDRDEPFAPRASRSR